MSRAAAGTGLVVLLAACLLQAGSPAVEAQDATQRAGFKVRVVEPANLEVVYGKTKIRAEVDIADPSLVDRVEFMIGDEVVFVDREPPYEFYYDFGEEQRSWIVRAVAWHVEGVSVSDVSITRKLKFSTIAEINRVILWLSATDDDGRLITDLARDEFKVYEDGREQQVLDFYVENRPITMAILIDTSGSMRDKIQEVHRAAGAFVDTLRDIDQALVIDFDENVFLIQDLTSDHEALKEAIGSTEPLGATSLFDALHAAYRKIGSLTGRKAIILLSDGEDTTSQFGYQRVLEEAKSNNTIVYTIGLGGEMTGSVDRDVLKEFAEVTGGRFFYVKKAGELQDTYQRIADELGKQYYLTYSTDNQAWDGHWIKIRVEPLRKGVDIRARRGYFAVRSADD